MRQWSSAISGSSSSSSTASAAGSSGAVGGWVASGSPGLGSDVAVCAFFAEVRHDLGRLAWDSYGTAGCDLHPAGACATAGSALMIRGTSETVRGSFELPLPLRADRFSKPAHSTTLPPLQVHACEI